MAERPWAIRTEPWGPAGDDWVILIQTDPRREMVMPRTELLRAAAAHVEYSALIEALARTAWKQRGLAVLGPWDAEQDDEGRELQDYLLRAAGAHADAALGLLRGEAP